MFFLRTKRAAYVTIVTTLCALSNSVYGKPSQTSNDNCFTAAVYEHVKSPSGSHFKAIEQNLNAYENALKAANREHADIIIFPEGGVIPISQRSLLIASGDNIPDPSLHQVHNPCRDAKNYRKESPLVKLSCLAKNYSIYIVANMLDIKPCLLANDTKCPKDSAYVYNTDVAFDREGQLIARYHKVHLFIESEKNPAQPEYVYFDTEFGRMGVFTCFDILFKEAAKLVREYDIDTVVYPTAWHDELPTYSAPLVQQAFAILHDVNFLAADIQNPRMGSVGSGIYSGNRGAINYTHAADNKPKLLVARLPRKGIARNQCEDSKTKDITTDKIPKEKVFPKSYVFQTTDFSDYALKPLKPGQHKEMVCHKGVCCNLDYKMSSSQLADEVFYLGAYNGTKVIVNRYRMCQEVCILLNCKAGNKMCSDVQVDTAIVFDYFNVTGTFSTEFVHPAVSGVYAKLVPKRHWEFSVSPKTKVASIRLTKQSKILSAVMNARCFDRDPVYKQ